MQKRDQTRTRHPDAHYAECELPGSFNGPHHFRIPSPIEASKLLSLASDDAVQRMKATGAIVGAAWAHESLDLETVNRGDMLEYGEAVFEELHAAGYRMEWMLLLQHIITTEIGNISRIGDEVRDRLGFSKAPQGANESINSTSETPTSETPSATTA